MYFNYVLIFLNKNVLMSVMSSTNQDLHSISIHDQSAE